MTYPAQTAWLDRYEVLGTLGEGGYGIVYEARERSTGERVALKELTRVNPTTLARFKHEFRAVQEVHHLNLVRLDALFEDRGKWVIAMELVEGSDLLSHLFTNEGTLSFNESQLRQVFVQLADGLLALHEAGFVHLDLKPSNVRVAPDGRVVLLDFGLTTALDADDQSSIADLTGTAAYMAPEQAAEAPLGPAADWYAFGVCLYEAMTGLLPLDAEQVSALLVAKQFEVPPRPSQLAPGIPTDLDDLCVALLSIDPEQRPSGAAVRATISKQAQASPSSDPVPARESKRPFEGREPELDLLGKAIARVQSGSQAVVLVEGDSGIGKSFLVRHFLRGLEGSDPEPIIFRNRCYENELLAFKAFDGTVEGIAKILSQLPAAEVQEILPPKAALLCRVFPALAQVKQIAEQRLIGLVADPSVQRLEAFGLFARLLTRLSQRAPIVIMIDDLQWADTDSFRLLNALLGGPHTPRVLVLATLRPRTELEGEAAREIEALRGASYVTEIELLGLPQAQATRLARELMGSAIPDTWLDIVVRESAGHPLFLTVLARFAESHDPKTAAELTLDAAIAARIGSLSSKARRLLETTALVGSPLAAPLCGRAAQLSDADQRRLVSELCSQKLLRRRRAGEIACFHDRIRRVLVESLPRVQSRAVHSQIASVLASVGDTDPAQLARHYEAAGQLERAYQAYRLAAEKALLYLAFARAAALYQRALEVSAGLDLPRAQRSLLHTARGHALARGGRSAEAAEQYQAAAAQADGEENTRLRLWAAQHLLQSAHVLAGMQAVRELLAELGVPLPKSTAGLVAQLAWDRTVLGVRGLEVVAATEPIEHRDQMQLDALWGLSLPVVWCEPLAGVALSTRHLRLARALGEPTHVTRALSEEAFARALQDPDAPEADELLARARAMAVGNTDPSLEVSLAFREAAVATWRWDLRVARERLEHAQRVGTESCPDQPWLLTNVRTNLASVWANVGEHARLATSCSAWLAEARERNDQFALTMIEGPGFGSFRHLMVDEPDRARSTLDAVLAPWPREPFAFARLGELIGVTYIELYRGGDGLARWLEPELPRLTRALMLRQPFGKATLLMYRGLANFSARSVARGARAERLLRDTREIIHELKGVKSALAAIMALSFEAQLAAIDGDTKLALFRAREVKNLCEARGYDLAQRIHYFEGLLEGGDAGRIKRESALQFYADQGWRKPRRAIAMICPALDELEARL